MIKILEYGKKNVCTCSVCGCKFTYDEDDIYSPIEDDIIRRERKYVYCPQCDILNRVEKN